MFRDVLQRMEPPKAATLSTQTQVLARPQTHSLVPSCCFFALCHFPCFCRRASSKPQYGARAHRQHNRFFALMFRGLDLFCKDSSGLLDLLPSCSAPGSDEFSRTDFRQHCIRNLAHEQALEPDSISISMGTGCGARLSNSAMSRARPTEMRFNLASISDAVVHVVAGHDDSALVT